MRTLAAVLRNLRPYRMLCSVWTILRGVVRYNWLLWRARHPRLAPSRARWDRAHRVTGRSIYRLATGLGGGFIKVGQVLGARADFFPASFLGPLKGLHDQVPPRPLARLRPHIESELGRSIDEVFAHIEPEPLAAASLAQVHRATLHGGAEVAVKIQYPEARRLFPSDLRSLRFATRVVHGINRGMNLQPLAKELAEFVTLELDFARERSSTERVRAAIGQSPVRDLRIPNIYGEFSTGRLLVLEFLEGTPLSRLDVTTVPASEREELARRIADLYTWMIFELGFFHGDPHPGNILVGPGSRLGLLDFGLARELPPGFASGVARMVIAGMSGDARGTLQAAEAIGFRIGGKNPEDFLHLVLMLLGDYRNSKSLIDVVTSAPVEDVPPEFALIVRTFVLLNGISERLAPGQRLITNSVVRALMPRVIEQKNSPDRSAAGAI